MEYEWFLCLSSFLFAASSTKTSTKSDVTAVRSCDKAANFLYGWCEQSMCEQGCRCKHNTKICKQICSADFCSSLRCISNKSCRQSTLVAEVDQRPNLRSMIATSVETQQDCSQAVCDLLFARRYPNVKSKALQVCPEGRCAKMISQTDVTEQLAGNADVMRCSGIHAKNCTQVCVLGHCKAMVCKAKYCRQRCAHNSQCDMTCGRNTEICYQECSYESKCNMKCSAQRCNQTCKSAKSNCSILRSKPRKTHKIFQIDMVNVTDTNVKFIDTSLHSKGEETRRENISTFKENSTRKYFVHESSVFTNLSERNSQNRTETNSAGSNTASRFGGIPGILVIAMITHLWELCT